MKRNTGKVPLELSNVIMASSYATLEPWLMIYSFDGEKTLLEIDQLCVDDEVSNFSTSNLIIFQ